MGRKKLLNGEKRVNLFFSVKRKYITKAKKSLVALADSFDQLEIDERIRDSEKDN